MASKDFQLSKLQRIAQTRWERKDKSIHRLDCGHVIESANEPEVCAENCLQSCHASLKKTEDGVYACAECTNITLKFVTEQNSSLNREDVLELRRGIEWTMTRHRRDTRICPLWRATISSELTAPRGIERFLEQTLINHSRIRAEQNDSDEVPCPRDDTVETEHNALRRSARNEKRARSPLNRPLSSVFNETRTDAPVKGGSSLMTSRKAQGGRKMANMKAKTAISSRELAGLRSEMVNKDQESIRGRSARTRERSEIPPSPEHRRAKRHLVASESGLGCNEARELSDIQESTNEAFALPTTNPTQAMLDNAPNRLEGDSSSTLSSPITIPTPSELRSPRESTTSEVAANIIRPSGASYPPLRAQYLAQSHSNDRRAMSSHGLGPTNSHRLPPPVHVQVPRRLPGPERHVFRPHQSTSSRSNSLFSRDHGHDGILNPHRPHNAQERGACTKTWLHNPRQPHICTFNLQGQNTSGARLPRPTATSSQSQVTSQHRGSGSHIRLPPISHRQQASTLPGIESLAPHLGKDRRLQQSHHGGTYQYGQPPGPPRYGPTTRNQRHGPNSAQSQSVLSAHLQQVRPSSQSQERPFSRSRSGPSSQSRPRPTSHLPPRPSPQWHGGSTHGLHRSRNHVPNELLEQAQNNYFRERDRRRAYAQSNWQGRPYQNHRLPQAATEDDNEVEDDQTPPQEIREESADFDREETVHNDADEDIDNESSDDIEAEEMDSGEEEADSMVVDGDSEEDEPEGADVINRINRRQQTWDEVMADLRRFQEEGRRRNGVYD